MPKPPHKNHGSQEQSATQQQDNPSSHSTTIAAAQWLGPLPPPDALAKFNDIIPGGAERIFAMAEEEQRHRIEYEKTALNANVSLSWLLLEPLPRLPWARIGACP